MPERRTAKKTVATPPSKDLSVSSDFLTGFLGSLDEVEQAANGLGQLQMATLITQENDDGPFVTATYVDRGWQVKITETTP